MFSYLDCTEEKENNLKFHNQISQPAGERTHTCCLFATDSTWICNIRDSDEEKENM